MTPEQAAWRPAPDRHNIWEIAVHAAYWKHDVYHAGQIQLLKTAESRGLTSSVVYNRLKG